MKYKVDYSNKFKFNMMKYSGFDSFIGLSKDEIKQVFFDKDILTFDKDDNLLVDGIDMSHSEDYCELDYNTLMRLEYYPVNEVKEPIDTSRKIKKEGVVDIKKQSFAEKLGEYWCKEATELVEEHIREVVMEQVKIKPLSEIDRKTVVDDLIENYNSFMEREKKMASLGAKMVQEKQVFEQALGHGKSATTHSSLIKDAYNMTVFKAMMKEKGMDIYGNKLSESKEFKEGYDEVKNNAYKYLPPNIEKNKGSTLKWAIDKIAKEGRYLSKGDFRRDNITGFWEEYVNNKWQRCKYKKPKKQKQEFDGENVVVISDHDEKIIMVVKRIDLEEAKSKGFRPASQSGINKFFKGTKKRTIEVTKDNVHEFYKKGKYFYYCYYKCKNLNISKNCYFKALSHEHNQITITEKEYLEGIKNDRN